MLAKKIILFDAACRLCTAWVSFLKKRDQGKFQFTAVQSPQGQDLLKLHGYPTDRFDTLVYLDGPLVFDKSAAIIAILSALGGAWRGVRFFLIVPASLRDYLYLKLALNRYRIFRSVGACRCANPRPRKKSLLPNK
jgi:predicted DCC family thiol-disulfide oxidoreductase YuxK